MEVFGLVCASLLGLVIGSFLNVVIYRVPRGESVVSPPSACPRCGTEIRARDNVPVLSWLLLRGRCRDCAEPISARYPTIELVTGLLFVATYLLVGFTWALPAYLYAGALAIALAMIDIDTKQLPNVLVLPSYVVALLLLLIPTIAEGDWTSYLRAIASGVILFVVYFLLALIYPKGMGWGDIKLAGVIGLYLGWLGWAELLFGGFLAFFLGGVVGMILIATKKATRKSAIPFGPYMLIGAYIGAVAGGPMAAAYVSFLSG